MLSGAVAAWTEFAGLSGRVSSIIGPSTVAIALWRQLAERWGTPGRRPATSAAPAGHVDPGRALGRCRICGCTGWAWTRDADSEAAVKMYTEEIGVSPVQGNSSGYRFYVRQLITSGRVLAFSATAGSFKADLGSLAGSVCQVQGVCSTPHCAAAGSRHRRWRRSPARPDDGRHVSLLT